VTRYIPDTYRDWLHGLDCCLRFTHGYVVSLAVAPLPYARWVRVWLACPTFGCYPVTRLLARLPVTFTFRYRLIYVWIAVALVAGLLLVNVLCCVLRLQFGVTLLLVVVTLRCWFAFDFGYTTFYGYTHTHAHVCRLHARHTHVAHALRVYSTLHTAHTFTHVGLHAHTHTHWFTFAGYGWLGCVAFGLRCNALRCSLCFALTFWLLLPVALRCYVVYHTHVTDCWICCGWLPRLRC